MTAFRSQTDEQLAAHHDPEPYEKNGNRYPVAQHRAFGVANYAPRVECIPGRLLPFGDGRSHPAYIQASRPPVNQVLVAFRGDWDGQDDDDFRYLSLSHWLNIIEGRPIGDTNTWAEEHFPTDATSVEIDHARKVLTRLANLKGDKK